MSEYSGSRILGPSDAGAPVPHCTRALDIIAGRSAAGWHRKAYAEKAFLRSLCPAQAAAQPSTTSLAMRNVAARAARLVLLLSALAAVTETKKNDASKSASISDSTLPPEGGSKYAEIHLAVTRGNVEKLKELLSAGVDVDLRTEEGFTTLHIAVARSQVRTKTLEPAY